MSKKLSPPSDATALDRLLVEFQNDAELARIGHYGMSAEAVLLYVKQIRASLAASLERPTPEGDYLRGYAAALIDSIAALTYARDAGGVDDAAFDGLNTAILAVRQMRPPTSAVPPALAASRERHSTDTKGVMTSEYAPNADGLRIVQSLRTNVRGDDGAATRLPAEGGVTHPPTNTSAASRERPTPEPTTTVKENTMQPTIGRILHYRLSEQDVTAMTRRRTNGASIADRMKADPPQWPAGAQAHIGNPLSIGDTVPLVVVRVWPNEFRTDIPGVNGQAFLDGNDTLWVLSAKEGTEPGTWSWPTKS